MMASPQLQRSAPYLPVADVRRSAGYYEKVFGFRSDYSAGDPPEFAILSRDGLSIMLRRVQAPEKTVPNEQQAYQMLEFAVRDSAGYVLGFGEALGRS